MPSLKPEEIVAYGTIFTTLILALITFWYALETRRMRKVMARDFTWRTQLSLEFEPLELSRNNDGSILIKQSLINLGIAPVTLTKALISWHSIQGDQSIHHILSDQLLPIFLLHDERRSITFKICASELQQIEMASEKPIHEYVTGEICYEYSDQHEQSNSKRINLIQRYRLGKSK
ncbi:MAG: hypothetical protein HY964_00625 [Ignavibacteriales bacterium]|nr:hypothetical protein [Ignavibacteriales bacterium]